jgi:hypothetical protein
VFLVELASFIGEIVDFAHAVLWFKLAVPSSSKAAHRNSYPARGVSKSRKKNTKMASKRTKTPC